MAPSPDGEGAGVSIVEPGFRLTLSNFDGPFDRGRPSDGERVIRECDRADLFGAIVSVRHRVANHAGIGHASRIELE